MSSETLAFESSTFAGASAADSSPFTSRLDHSFFTDPPTLAALLSRDRKPQAKSPTKLWACIALLAVGLAEALLILEQPPVLRYTATATAALPYAASLPGGVSSFRASASTPGAAVALANSAAIQAVRLNADAWARAIKDSDQSGRASLAELPVAHVVGTGADDIIGERTGYRFEADRAPLAGGCAALFGLPALLYGALLPLWARRGERAERRLFSGLKRAARAGGPQIESLPRLASVQMARDVSRLSEAGQYGSATRPILSDASEQLWLNFASPADIILESASQTLPQPAQPTLAPVANTEILFTRLTQDARGSRAALLAVARLLAQRSKRVAIVDLDFAAGSDAKAELGLPGECPGAAQLLARAAALDDCLLADDEYPSLSALSAGWDGAEPSAAQASRLLDSAEMLDLLDALRHDNQLVLIHGPVASEAALALGARADAVLLVTNQEPTDAEREACPDALARMNAAQVNLAGRVEFVPGLL